MKIYVISFLFSFCLCIMGCKANQTSSNSDKTSSSQIAALVNEMDSLKAQIKMANKTLTKQSENSYNKNAYEKI